MTFQPMQRRGKPRLRAPPHRQLFKLRPRGKRQSQLHADAVDQLPRVQIGGTAKQLVAFRRNGDRLRRPAGEMPRQVRRVHQLHMAGGKERGGDVPLLM